MLSPSSSVAVAGRSRLRVYVPSVMPSVPLKPDISCGSVTSSAPANASVPVKPSSPANVKEPPPMESVSVTVQPAPMNALAAKVTSCPFASSVVSPQNHTALSTDVSAIS